MAPPPASDQPRLVIKDAKSSSSGKSNTLGILKVIPEQQRLMGLVFLIGESMFGGDLSPRND